MQTLWKKDQSLHPRFARINQCLHEDWFLLPHELKLQRAHAKTLEVAGILTGGERAAIARALEQIERRYGGAACPESDAEDLHTWVEGKLTEAAGEAGSKIHTARS
ncbi:MAG: argininosuccinate lyase, partial [Phycisphaerae bacterium]